MAGSASSLGLESFLSPPSRIMNDQRINNPTYLGNFSLLVEDPFKKNEENRGEN